MFKKYLVRHFVKNINKDFRVSFADTFEVDIPEEHIYITFNYDKELDQMYDDFLYEQFGKRYNIFLLSLLHEVGHIITYEDELEEDRDIIYGLLKLDYEEGKSDIAEYNHKYFLIPMEFEATCWAVEYYENHKEKCDKLIKRLGM